MKIEQHEYSGYLRIDAQTRREGNSAVWVAEDDNTQVFFGGLYGRVTLKDLRVEVTMDPNSGAWHDVEWARRKALEVMLDPETVVNVVIALCELNRNIGKKEGRKELQIEFLKLLGTGS